MRRAFFSSVTWLLVACAVTTAQQPPQPPPRADTIEAWLECVECDAGELQAVVKLGQSAVPRLGPSLLSGPPAAKQKSYEAYLRKMYADMKAYEKTHPKSVVPFTEDEFVKRDMAKYTNMYRVRAANALGEIGGTEAAQVLDKALTLPNLDTYVAMKIKQALSKAKIK